MSVQAIAAVGRTAFKSMRANETVFFSHRPMQCFGWLSNDMLKPEMRRWRAMKRAGTLYIMPENSETHTIDGKEVYVLVLTTEDYGFDKLGHVFDDPILVDGLIYAFTIKENRDRVQAYVMSDPA
jgi:hypothetical protein